MPEMSYEEKEAVLGDGDSVLFYSDGLVEAHDPGYEMFGFPRLGALIAEHGNERSLVDFLLEAALHLHWGGLGAGGRHHPSYDTVFSSSRSNVGKSLKGEVRRITLPALR